MTRRVEYHLQGGQTMSIINNHEPKQCTICGYYLTTSAEYTGRRCLDPAHWQAAGLLASSDFYPMARIAAQAHAEFKVRFDDAVASNHCFVVGKMN
jgi:hypothetical protein